MIDVRNLSLEFGEGDKRNQVLFDVNFNVQPGKSTAWSGSPVPVKPRC